jgi:drug/metabolite transporter (DMT)-like permease
MKQGRWVRQFVLPLVAAVIWGTAFVFQSDSAEHIEPFTFNALRSAVAVVFLALVLLVRRQLLERGVRTKRTKQQKRKLLWGGFLCGTVLTIAANLQQLGIEHTTTGKAAFITALYVVLVPLGGLIVFRKRQGAALWVSVAVAVVGLYFLCFHGAERVAIGDIYVLLCAVAFAVQIMIVDRVGSQLDGIELSLVQFAVVTVWSSIGMLLTEHPTLEAILPCVPAVLYVGVLSSGVAYTLQIISQKDANPAVVSLLLSLESVVATAAAVLMRGEWMTGREMLGSALMLIAVVLAQIPTAFWRKVLPIGRKE